MDATKGCSIQNMGAIRLESLLMSLLTADPPVLDTERLASFTQGDAALARELACLYLETASAYLATLTAAAGDQAAWRSAAHALKGASANIGAMRVAAIAGSAERENPSRDRLDQLRTALVEITHALAGPTGRAALH
jgi:HPt (histidine-containing phosphotransfer) domain-containing protein